MNGYRYLYICFVRGFDNGEMLVGGEGEKEGEREKKKKKKAKKAEEEPSKKNSLTSSSDPELTPLIDFRNGGACSVAMARAKSAATTR